MLIKIYIIILLSSSFLFSQDSDRLIKYSAFEPSVNLIISLFEKSYSQNEVKGVQFDIFYDIDQLDFNALTCLIDGTTFEYVQIKEGQKRCVIFNLDGKSFSRIELSKLIAMSFTQKNNFYDYAIIKLENFIVAGDYGQDISDQYKTSSFEINFNGLKPKRTYIHDLENSIFQDSTMIYFQIHEPSLVNLTVYDIFNFKRKTIIDEYLDIGIHNVYMNSYDEFQERLSDGEYKIKLNANYSLKDSIFIFFEKNKN